MRATRLLLCSLVLALSACGGSGDDDMDISPSSLEFSGTVGQDIAARTVDVNIGVSPERRYVDYANNNPNLVTVDLDIDTLDEFELRIKPVSGLAAGTYNGTVDALVCDDDDCDDIDERGTITYTIVIR